MSPLSLPPSVFLPLSLLPTILISTPIKSLTDPAVPLLTGARYRPSGHVIYGRLSGRLCRLTTVLWRSQWLSSVLGSWRCEHPMLTLPPPEKLALEGDGDQQGFSNAGLQVTPPGWGQGRKSPWGSSPGCCPSSSGRTQQLPVDRMKNTLEIPLPNQKFQATSSYFAWNILGETPWNCQQSTALT